MGGIASFLTQAGQAYDANNAGGTACVSYKFGLLQAGTLSAAALGSGGAATGYWFLSQVYNFTYNSGGKCRDLYG